MTQLSVAIFLAAVLSAAIIGTAFRQQPNVELRDYIAGGFDNTIWRLNRVTGELMVCGLATADAKPYCVVASQTR